jgi:endonuclease G
MLFDTDHRVALWVAYPLHATYLGAVGRTNEWAFDPQLPTSQQAQVANGYFGSPYQRGHQIPSADRLVNYEANAQTFYATNLTAQNGTLNSGLWADLEGFVRSKNCKDTLYVVTGCVVKEGGERRQGATVPTSYFKALLRTQKGSTGVYASDENAMCIAFLIDNKSNSGDVSAKHAISVATLEDMLGYELFPAISRSVKEQCTPSRWALK